MKTIKRLTMENGHALTLLLISGMSTTNTLLLIYIHNNIYIDSKRLISNDFESSVNLKYLWYQVRHRQNNGP